MSPTASSRTTAPATIAAAAAADPSAVPARDPDAALTGPGLAWAFHAGFAAYVSRLADGRSDVGGGARRLPDGRVFFPSTTGPAAAGMRCLGALHFTGHRGMLAVTLAQPAIEAGAVLTVADPFTPGARMVLAELGSADLRSVDLWSVDPGGAGLGAGAPSSDGPTVRQSRRYTQVYPEPRLTETGADLFLGHYREGTALAPLEVLSSAASAAGTGAPGGPVPARSLPARSLPARPTTDQDA